MGNIATIIKGDISPQLQRQVYVFDPLRGYTFLQEWRGASQADMLALASDYTRQGVANTITFEKDIAVLSVDDSTQQFTLDVWQILGNELTQSGLSHPTLTALLSDEQSASLAGGLSQPPDPLDTTITFIATLLAKPVFNSLTAAQKTIVTRFCGLNLRGATDFRIAQYVMRHTTNVPNNSQTQYPFTNVNRLYSTANMITELQATTWVNPIPGVIATSLLSVDSQLSTEFPAPAFYAWTWLKGSTTQTSAANNRVELSTEFTFALWSEDYYNFAR